MWNDLILAHEGPSNTRDTKIAALRLKFNAFKSLEGEKVNGNFTGLKCLLNDLKNNGVTIPQAKVNAIDSDVEEDQRTNNEFMANLNVEYHERALLANQKSNHQKDYKEKYKGLKAKMAILTKRIDDMTKGKSEKGKKEKEKSEKDLIAESFDWDDEFDEPSVGKADARSGQWVDITMKKVHRLLSMTDVPDKALGGKGRRREKISSKEVIFTKADESSSVLAPKITSDLESECDSHESLPPLPKLIGAAPSNTSESLISLSDLTINMADLTLDTPVPKKTRPSVKADSSTKQLLLTLIEKVKCIKRKIEIPLGTPPSSSQPCSSKATKQKTWITSRGTSPKVVFGDDSLRDTEGYGSVKCNGITFTRVAYVNGLKHNLISISQLCDANYIVLFTKTQGTIYNQNDEVVFIAPKRRDVYVIDISSFNKESNACFFAKASPSVNWLWHKRLSHLNFKNINNLAKHNLVSSLPSLTFSKDKNYSACEKGKHHRASFKTKRSFSISKSLHLLHMDLFGPVKPQTISHNKFTLVIIDEYSRKMENLNEVRVKKLRSDNGIEFKNHKMEEFCDEKDISQNFSSPSEQNGIAERRNKTLIEAARTMLNSAKLPKQIWGEVVNTSSYTQNRSIIVKRHGKTSYDVFSWRFSVISAFSLCLVVSCHIHKSQVHFGKVCMEKADDGIYFIGYSIVG
ncbi:retrovirus-related pol polyprotein from transposon TNT 1-94 [Tanacetum coccineum]